MNEIERLKGLGARIGKNVSMIGPQDFSSEPYLISIGDDTTISFGVHFVTHDGATRVIRKLDGQNKETVIYGTIEVGKNCFIGCESVILPNVKIGNNSIIGAGSVVNRDVPPNSVACGVPCKVICTIDDYVKKHKDDFLYMVSMPPKEKKEYLLKHFKLNQ